MAQFVSIPTETGEVAFTLHSVDKIERVGSRTEIKLYSGEVYYTSLTARAVVNRITKAALAYEKALNARMK